MKTLTLQEEIKQRFRDMSEEQAREYHFTHNYYNGRAFNTPYKEKEKPDIDPEEVIGKNDLAFMNALLYPQPTLSSVLGDAFKAAFAVQNDQTVVTEAADPPVKASVDLVRRAIVFYETWQEKGVTEVLAGESEKLSPESLAVIKSIYSNTTFIQNLLMLSSFWLRSPQTWDARSDRSLLEHLFVQYEVPRCLNKMWHKTAKEYNLQWLLVYILYAQGGSMKPLVKYFNWRVTTQKVWHELFQAEAKHEPAHAVMLLELDRLGCSADDRYYILLNEAYVIDILAHSHEATLDFWFGTIRWMARFNDTLVGTEKARVLTWARHAFTEAVREGKTFTMKGRSFDKVTTSANDYERAQWLRQVELARRQEAARQAAIAREAERGRRLAEERARLEERRYGNGYQTAIDCRIEAIEEWEQDYGETYSSEFDSWDAYGWGWKIDLGANETWEFEELTNVNALSREAASMQHCVMTYFYDCYQMESAIVSLSLNGKPCITIEIEPESKHLVQASGRHNRDVLPDEWEVISMWMRQVVRGSFDDYY